MGPDFYVVRSDDCAAKTVYGARPREAARGRNPRRWRIGSAREKASASAWRAGPLILLSRAKPQKSHAALQRLVTEKSQTAGSLRSSIAHHIRSGREPSREAPPLIDRREIVAVTRQSSQVDIL